jgi:DNA polymerase-3 subunit delta
VSGRRSRLATVPDLKPAYLLHGDDHGRLAERRARLRALAERESGAAGVEWFEGDASTPDAVAAALNAMTFAVGRRFLIVEGVEQWRDADVEAALVPALHGIADDTTVAFFAREEGRAKAPAALASAVRDAGGDVVAEMTLRARELPRWVAGEAQRLGLTLESGAAPSLIAHVGDRQQRLLRELEKLALEHGPGARLGVEEIEASAAPSAERQVWALVDALVARDGPAATRAFLRLRAQGEGIARLVPAMARRLREVLAIAVRLEAGESPAQVKAGLRMPPYAASRRVQEARATDAATLRRAIEALGELELASRGQSELADDTVALRAIVEAAA